MTRCTPLLLCLALAACGETSDPQTALDQAALPATYLEALPDSLSGALELRRLIVKTNSPGCPPLTGNWSGTPMFGAAPPAGLQNFCRFDWNATTAPTTSDLQAAINQSTSTLAVYPDRPAAAPMGPPLAAVYEDRAVVVSRVHAGDILSKTGQPPVAVKVAVLDNLPTLSHLQQPWLNQSKPHGHAMAHIVHDLACDDADNCAIDVSTRLAMPFEAGDPLVEDAVGGGDFGSLGSLAVAIYDEVTDWSQGTDHTHLVLNLSLAWHPSYGGIGDPAVHPDVEAVHAALMDAHCRGALVIAAGGNTSSGSAMLTGPMLPAGWGTEIVSTTDCQAAIGSDGAAPGTPLLYAVSGLNTYKKNIGNSRVHNRSPWTAYANAFTLEAPTTPLPPRTGTSMAAAVVSSAVGTVLAWRPDLSPHEAMTFLNTHGGGVGGVDAYWSSLNLPARRVRVCQSLRSACLENTNAAGCQPAEVPTCSWGNPHITFDPEVLQAWKDDAASVPYVPVVVDHQNTCPNAVYRESAAPDPVAPCPEFQFYDDPTTVPHTDPQPNDGHCPECTVAIGTDTLLLESTTPFDQHTDRVIKVVHNDNSLSTFHVPALPAVTSIQHTFPNGAFAGVKSATWTSEVNGIVKTNALVIKP